MLRTIFLIVIFLAVWSSPDLRAYTANALRLTATWIEPKKAVEQNPRYFQIPNPFYENHEKK